MMPNIFLISILTLIASIIGTVTGFGTSTIMVPIISFILPVPETLLFVGIIHWFSNIWKITFFKKGINVKLVLLFGIPGLIVSFFAAGLPLILPTHLLKQLFGLFLISYSVFVFCKPRWKLKADSRNAVVGGALSGFFSGVFGVGGSIRSAFLSAFNLQKATFLVTSGVIGFMIDSSRLVQYIIGDTRLTAPWLFILLICIPISFVGAFIAKNFVNKIQQKSFRTIVLIALFLIGLRYLILGEIYL